MTMIAVIALAATVVVSPVGARMGGGGGYPGGGGYYDLAAVPGLNLTAEQTAQIRNLREAHLKDIQPLQNKLYGKRGELRLLWLQQSPDQGKILAVQKEIRTIRDQMQDKMTIQRLNILKVLTPEQQERMKAFGQGRGFGPGMKGGPGFDGRGSGMRSGAGWQSGPCNYGGGPGMMRGNW